MTMLCLVFVAASWPFVNICQARSAAQNFKCKDGTTVLGYAGREACADHGGRDRSAAQGTTEATPPK